MPERAPLPESGWERLWYRPRGGWRLLSGLLVPMGWLFGAVVRLRGWLFDIGALASERVEARVISVGNLNVGGAGKTPVVVHLAHALQTAGHRVGVLSRGYGRVGSREVVFAGRGDAISVETLGDEPALIARRLPGVAVLVGRDRRQMARRAVQELGCDTLLLDDGFQHRRLRRDCDLLVLGGGHPLGNRRLLPAGPLREGIEGAHRATLTWVIDAGEDPPPVAFPSARIVSRTRVRDVLDTAGASLGADSLQGKRVWMLAGLARPSGFSNTLGALGAEVVGSALFPDHHAYTSRDLERVQANARSADAQVVATTEKDFVRIPAGLQWSVPLAVVQIELEILSGGEHIEAMVGHRRSGC